MRVSLTSARMLEPYKVLQVGEPTKAEAVVRQGCPRCEVCAGEGYNTGNSIVSFLT